MNATALALTAASVLTTACAASLPRSTTGSPPTAPERATNGLRCSTWRWRELLFDDGRTRTGRPNCGWSRDWATLGKGEAC